MFCNLLPWWCGSIRGPRWVETIATCKTCTMLWVSNQFQFPWISPCEDHSHCEKLFIWVIPRLHTRPLYLSACCGAWPESPYFINRCVVYGWQGCVDKTLWPCQVMLMVKVTAVWPYEVLEEPLVTSTNLLFCKIKFSYCRYFRWWFVVSGIII